MDFNQEVIDSGCKTQTSMSLRGISYFGIHCLPVELKAHCLRACIWLRNKKFLKKKPLGPDVSMVIR